MSVRLEHAKALYLEGIRDGRAREAIEAHTGARYTQHSAGVGDGPEGFVAFFEPFIERNPKREIEIVRGFEDGRFVFVQAYQSLNDGEAEWVTTDLFDTDENDKIIEHWDIIAPFRGPNPSGRTTIDGPTEVTDLDKTDQNKAVVREMIKQILMPGGNLDRIGEFIADDYIQHNPDVGDGLAEFRELAVAPDRALWYSEIVLLVGQGNFVSTLCMVSLAGKPYAQADIFRLDNGKIVEHWDNAEPIGPEEEWVNSGKF